MSGHDSVFYKTAANYIMNDIGQTPSKLRGRSMEMPDPMEAGLAEWTDSSKAWQMQKECAQRFNDCAEELTTTLDSLKQAFEEIHKAGVSAKILAFAVID